MTEMHTQFFAYENLTWPDVAALPRDTPLIIPLGEGYELAQLATALGNPARAGLLPAIPFGWRGSGLAVPEALLGRLVGNLLDSLRDDGFSRVVALTPQAVDLGLGAQRIALPHSSQTMTAPLLPSSAALDEVVVIPIGHTEQHGYHLPLATDTLIIGHIGRETAVSNLYKVSDEANQSKEYLHHNIRTTISIVDNVALYLGEVVELAGKHPTVQDFHLLLGRQSYMCQIG